MTADIIDLTRYLNPITPDIRRDIRRGTKFCSECKRRMWLHSDPQLNQCVAAARKRQGESK
jgi:hypothetical protein